MTRGAATRERVLEVAEQTILRQGFAGTSLDDILAKAHITKGGFFYHFKGKNDLAVCLMKRYQINDRAFFKALTERAMELSEDPLQQLLLFLKLLAEQMADLPSVHPGCLVATFTYEAQVNEEVSQINRECVLEWRQIFIDQLARVEPYYEMAIEVPHTELADMLTTIIEGGIIASKALADQQILVQQILQYRNYIRLLYRPRKDNAAA